MVKRKKVIWSDKARQDLLEILHFYNQRNGNVRFSSRLFKKILKDIYLISDHAFLGKQTDHENIFAAAPSSAINNKQAAFIVILNKII